MRFIILLAAFAITACAPDSPAPRRQATPVFDPIAFFTGSSEGRASLKLIMHRPSNLVVHSIGRVMPDGSLVLDQRIVRPGHELKQRQWRIARTDTGGYQATLTSAQGPVAVSVDGNLLRLDFQEDKLRIHQDIVLAADSRSAVNHMTMTRFGIRVATIEEHIARQN